MGSSSLISKRHAFRCDPGRFIQVKITRLCSASDRLGFVKSRNCSKQWTDKLFTIKNICETSYWSDDEDSRLQSPQRSSGMRISHQESKRKESLRREESWRVFPVGGTWTMFKKRLVESQARQTSARRRVWWSETKRAIVLSRTKFEGQG